MDCDHFGKLGADFTIENCIHYSRNCTIIIIMEVARWLKGIRNYVCIMMGFLLKYWKMEFSCFLMLMMLILILANHLICSTKDIDHEEHLGMMNQCCLAYISLDQFKLGKCLAEPMTLL